MKRKVGLLAGLAAVVMVLAGCTTFRAEGLSFMPMPDDMQVVGTFEDSVWVHKFLGSSGGQNLFNISSGATINKLSNAISKNIQKLGGTGAVDVKITYGANIGHWFLNALTWNVWAPAKITVSGTVVRGKGQETSQQQLEQVVQEALSDATE